MKIEHPRLATEDDWMKISQHGKPRVVAHGNHYDIIHDYRGGNGKVIATLPQDLEKTVTLDLEGEPVIFPSALLERFHGKPCELQSRQIGGRAYGQNRNH